VNVFLGHITVLRSIYIDAVCCGDRPSSVVCWSVTVVSSAEVAEPVEKLFGLRTQMGPWNHVLDVGPHLQIHPCMYVSFGQWSSLLLCPYAEAFI